MVHYKHLRPALQLLVNFKLFSYLTHSDVSKSFLSSQSHNHFESESSKFFSSQCHNLAESVRRTVESLRVIGLQARVNAESHEISRFFYDIFCYEMAPNMQSNGVRQV